MDVELSRRVRSTLAQAHAQAALVMEEARLRAGDGRDRLHGCVPDWDVRAEALLGTPALTVMQHAEAWHADLIVVGSQGRSGIGRVVFGSVSPQVANESACSVLVARHVVRRGTAPVRIIVGRI